MATISAVIKWTSNTDELRRELAAGADQLVVLEKAAERTTRNLGGEGILRAAHNAAAAVQQLGGATKLTSAEQGKINSLMERAIAKYDALGQRAPSALRQLAEATKASAAATSSLDDHLQQIQKHVSAFSGNKLIQEAHQLARAVQEVGGADKLTAAEQQKVNALVTEAIGKYKALGQQAPQSLHSLANATKQVEEKLTLAQRATGLLTSAFGQFTLAGLATSLINKLTSEIGEFIKQGSKLPAIEGSFERLSRGVKQNGSEMRDAMRSATKGMVSDLDLMQTANKAMLLGLPVTTKSMGELAKTATVLGKAMGQDATKSLDDLITALGRSSPMILDNLGLTVKVGEANEAYAKKLGKTVEQLTDAEKKIAFYDAAMEAARVKTKELGDQTQTLGEIVSSVWTQIGNKVTGVAADVNVGVGRILSSTKEFATFVSDVTQMGLGAAVAAAGVRARIAEEVAQAAAGHKDVNLAVPGADLRKLQEEAKKLATTAIAPLTAAQRDLVLAFDKGGLSAAKIVEKLQTVSSTAKVTEAQVQALIDAHKKAAHAGDEHAKALKDIADAQIPLTAKQRESIKALYDQGVSAETIAKALNLGKIAVQNYTDTLAFSLKIEKELDDFQKERIKTIHSLVEASNKRVEAEQAARAGLGVDAQAAQLKTLLEFTEKNAQATMQGTELRLHLIEVERNAVLKSLEKQYTGQSELYAKSAAEVDKYYDHLHDLAAKTPDTLIERLKAEGVLTRDELKKLAEEAQRDFNIMKSLRGDDGKTLFTPQAIQKAKEELEDLKQKAGMGPFSLDTQEAFRVISEAASGMAKYVHGATGQLLTDIAKTATDLAAAKTKIEAFDAALAGLKGINAAFGDRSGITSLLNDLGLVAHTVDDVQKAVKTAGTSFTAMQTAFDAGKTLEGIKNITTGLLGIAAAGVSIGKALQPLLGLRHGLLGKLLGTNADGRAMVKEFAESFGGFDELHQKLLTKLGDAFGEKLWIELTQRVGRSDKEGAQKIIDQINAAFKDAPISAVESFAEQAEQAGFQTQEALRKVADDAVNLWEFMRDSGEYSAEAVQQAWERAQAALVAAGDQTTIAVQKTHDEIKKLDDEMKSLTESIANEAPEEEMGVVERQTRDRIEQLAAQRKLLEEQLQAASDETANSAAEAGATVDEELGGAIHRTGELIDLNKGAWRGWADNAISEAERVARALGSLSFPTPTGEVPEPADTASTGGYVVPTGIVPTYARGGVVEAEHFDTGGLVRFMPRGTDTVPAMLTPKEGVVNVQGMDLLGTQGLAQLNHGIAPTILPSTSQMTSAQPQAVSVVIRNAFHLSGVDGPSIQRMVASRDFTEELERQLLRNVNGLATAVRQVRT